MKLVILGDTHSSHHAVALPPGDILIHTGDLLGGAWNKTQFEDLRAWFTGMDFEHKIYVPGNHDGLVQKDTDWVRTALPGVTILIDEEITIGHLKFYGTPWTPPFMSVSGSSHEDTPYLCGEESCWLGTFCLIYMYTYGSLI